MNIFDQMVARYEVSTVAQKRNATCEVMQEITLAGLYRSGFFNKAAFYGGTCLRIFHNLPRFSEDMDFSLIRKSSEFNLEDYFPAIIEEFKAAGQEVVITRKEKKNETNVESAFLKADTAMYDMNFKSVRDFKVKIEVDVNPPEGFNTEQKLSMLPFSFMTRCFTLEDLFAGKMHALLFRNWKNRIKGRDWFDFEWYIRHNIPLNFSHLQIRAKEFNGLDLDKDSFREMLNNRLASSDIQLVKNDVSPFVENPASLDIWSNEYFLLLSERIKFF